MTQYEARLWMQWLQSRSLARQQARIDRMERRLAWLVLVVLFITLLLLGGP